MQRSNERQGGEKSGADGQEKEGELNGNRKQGPCRTR